MWLFYYKLTKMYGYFFTTPVQHFGQLLLFCFFLCFLNNSIWLFRHALSYSWNKNTNNIMFFQMSAGIDVSWLPNAVLGPGRWYHHTEFRERERHLAVRVRVNIAQLLHWQQMRDSARQWRMGDMHMSTYETWYASFRPTVHHSEKAIHVWNH